MLNIRLDALGRHFGRLHLTDAVRLWYWARGLLAVYRLGLAGCGERLTETEIGARVGQAARGQPYSKAWVSLVLSAARRWPQRPAERHKTAAGAKSRAVNPDGKASSDKSEIYLDKPKSEV